MFEKRYGRERWRRRATISLRPVVNASGGPAERLAQRGRDHVDALHDAAMLDGSAPRLADKTGGVAVVDHDHRPVALGQVADGLEWRDVAIHGEDAVGSDHAQALALRLLQRIFQRAEVPVRVPVALGLAQADAVDDGGVVERVADDGVLFAEERLEEAAVGVEARRVEDGVFRAEKFADLAFELLVRVLGAANEAHAGEAEAVFVEGAAGGVEDARVGAQAEVVVGAEVEHRAVAFAHADAGALRAEELAFALLETGGADVFEGGGVKFLGTSVHGSRGRVAPGHAIVDTARHARPASRHLVPRHHDAPRRRLRAGPRAEGPGPPPERHLGVTRSRPGKS